MTTPNEELRARRAAIATPTPQAGEPNIGVGVDVSKDGIDVVVALREGAVDRIIHHEHHDLPQASAEGVDAEWEIRADGQRVRKDRWETGFRNIVGILVGARTEFEIPDIVERVRALTTAGQQAAGVSDVVARKIAHFIYCHVGACHGRSECFGGADAGTQAQWIEAVTIALNTAAGAAPEGWQPIETAPENVPVWVFVEDSDPQQFVATLVERDPSVGGWYWHPAEQLVADVMDSEFNPSHWRHLPPSPQPGAQHGQEGRDHG